MNIPTTPRRYFAASNSCQGFCNYYGDCFSERRTDRLYIIKGGPGTGKSHFMKSVARRARAVGYDVTEYYCSSDPASLDGILLQKDGAPSIGFLDGTAPHVCEPGTPGVREEILNLGAFWDGDRLIGEGETIRRLGAGKAAAYERAYAYLRAAGALDAVSDSLMEGCIRIDRLRALADRLLRQQPAGHIFDPQPALRRAISMAGKACFHTFEAEAAGGTVVILEDYYGIGSRLMQEIWALSKARRHVLKVSYDPLYPHKIDGLLYPDTGLCILMGDAEVLEGTAVRTVSLRRYAHAAALRAVRGEVRYVHRLKNGLVEGALHSLSTASLYHFDMEKIYSEAMDFSAKEAFTDRFCDDLFGDSAN